jgi:hypothetical protein
MAEPILQEVSQFMIANNELEKEALQELEEIDKVEKVVNQDYSLDIPDNLGMCINFIKVTRQLC